MATPKPPIPPMYGGPLGSLLSLIQNRGRVQQVPADIRATGFRPTQPIPPQYPYTQLPDGSMVQLPGQVNYGDKPEDFGYGQNPTYPTDPYSSTVGQDILGPQQTPGMTQPDPFPGYPQEPLPRDPFRVPTPTIDPPSYGDINSFVQANIGDPRAIADAIGKYGVSASDLAGATGYNNDQINQYFSNAGFDPYGSMKSQQDAMDAAKQEQEISRTNPVPNVLPSDMDFMRQNGII